MIQEIIVNGDDADALYTVSLDGEEFRLRLQWMEEATAWFLSLYSPEGSPILLTRRLTPGSSPCLTTRAVKGLLFVVGDPSVPVERGDLGTTLRLFYSEEDTTFEDAFG